MPYSLDEDEEVIFDWEEDQEIKEEGEDEDMDIVEDEEEEAETPVIETGRDHRQPVFTPVFTPHAPFPSSATVRPVLAGPSTLYASAGQAGAMTGSSSSSPYIEPGPHSLAPTPDAYHGYAGYPVGWYQSAYPPYANAYYTPDPPSQSAHPYPHYPLAPLQYPTSSFSTLPSAPFPGQHMAPVPRPPFAPFAHTPYVAHPFDQTSGPIRKAEIGSIAVGPAKKRKRDAHRGQRQPQRAADGNDVDEMGGGEAGRVRNPLPVLPEGDEWVMVDAYDRRELLGWRLEDDLDPASGRRKAGVRVLGVSQFVVNIANLERATFRDDLDLRKELYRRFRTCGGIVSLIFPCREPV